MFKGLTQRAQRVLTVLAQEEAKRFHSDQLQPEHVVLALLKDGDGVAVKALQRVKVNIAEMQLEIERSIPKKSGGLILGDVPTSSRGKRILEDSAEEARNLGHEYIGTEHLLLAAAKETGSSTARYLARYNISAAVLRDIIIRITGLGHFRDPEQGKKRPGRAAPDAADGGQGDADAQRVLPRPHLLRPPGQARSRHRQGQGDPAGHPDPGAAHQEQPGAHRGAGGRQDRHRRGPRSKDRRRHRAGSAHRKAGPDPGPRFAGGRHQVPR